MFYSFENGEIKPVTQITDSVWDLENRKIDYTDINEDIYVSTVFLVIDHNFGDRGPPVLFETMIFGGEHDGTQYRYTNVEDAKKGHKKAVLLAKNGLKNRIRKITAPWNISKEC